MLKFYASLQVNKTIVFHSTWQSCRFFANEKQILRTLFGRENFYGPGRSGYFSKKSGTPKISRRRKNWSVRCTSDYRI